MELMVVVAIIAILTGVAVPNVLGWLSKRVAGDTTRQIFNAVQVARISAIKNSTNVVFEFMDADGNGYYDSYRAFLDNGFVKMNNNIPEYNDDPTKLDRLSDNEILDPPEKVVLRGEINKRIKINNNNPGDIDNAKFNNGRHIIVFNPKGRIGNPNTDGSNYGGRNQISMYGAGRHLGIDIDIIGLPRIIKSLDGSAWTYNGESI